MAILPSETVLTGKWVERDGQIVADEVAERISQLIDSELRYLGKDESGWDTLYLDPLDGRFWELIFPQSELHGGGPPQLRNLTKAEVESKYGRKTS